MSHDSFPDWNLLKLAECPSTNTELKNRVETGSARAGTVLVTGQQLEGRGRLNREWVSPPGNIALSAAIPVDAADKAYQLGLIAGSALAEIVTRRGNLSAQVKWPNDVLVKGLKLAGILSELARVPDSSESVAIIGIGVNFNSTRADFPEELRNRITTLKDAAPAITWDENDFVAAFLRELRARLLRYAEGGLAVLLPDIESRLAWKNETVSISEAGFPAFQATLTGLNEDGFLNVTSKDGTLRHIVAADVELAPKVKK